jgi:site-specific DNA-methyltransferase (adenine-specific)
LERIIAASSNKGDTVLDPFCGCGTALHAAELLDRNWIGIDISRFSVGVVKSRLVESFKDENPNILKQIKVSGVPTDPESARALARENPWEFEKWACGQLGAKGLYKRLGAKGADQGIDGVIEFYAKPKEMSYAIVQVKGGQVKVNDVKALYSDVDKEPSATAGVFVCFDQYKATATNAATIKTFEDEIAGNQWPVIQILTVEEILEGRMPKLPNQVIQQGFRTHRARQRELAL